MILYPQFLVSSFVICKTKNISQCLKYSALSMSHFAWRIKTTPLKHVLLGCANLDVLIQREGEINGSWHAAPLSYSGCPCVCLFVCLCFHISTIALHTCSTLCIHFPRGIYPFTETLCCHPTSSLYLCSCVAVDKTTRLHSF